MTGSFGNPHSRTHAYGWEAEAAVEHAREQVAALIGASSKEIIFTSGATECNNMAIKGVARFYREKKRHVITTQIEHKCVLDSCRALEQEGFRVTYLPVQKNGLVDLQVLQDAITPETALVSIMAVNNEIGVLQPLREIGQICRDRKVGGWVGGWGGRGERGHTTPSTAIGRTGWDPHTTPRRRPSITCVCAGVLPLGHRADGGQDAHQRGRLQDRPGLHLQPQGACWVCVCVLADEARRGETKPRVRA